MVKVRQGLVNTRQASVKARQTMVKARQGMGKVRQAVVKARQCVAKTRCSGLGAVPEGPARIARHFSAGSAWGNARVPKGRLKFKAWDQPSLRDSTGAA